MQNSIVKKQKPQDSNSPPENPEKPQGASQKVESDQPFAGKEYGEGNYKAAKEYDDATREFIRAGRVPEAARDAEPRTGQEARELADAEAQGRLRSKGEDPALKPASQKRKK